MRSSSPPAPGEPSVAPHPKSYMEASTFVVPLFLRNSYSCNWKFICVYACLIHAACSHFLGYLIFVSFFGGNNVADHGNGAERGETSQH